MADEGMGEADLGDGADGDPRQLLAQREIVQRELARMERRMAAIEEAMVEAQRAAATVRAVADAKGGDLLVPVGAGVHVKATARADDRFLLPLGAGYFTEDGADRVVAALEARAEAVTRSFEEASRQAEELAMAAAAIEERLAEG